MKKFIYLALIVVCFSCKKDNDTTNNSNDSNKEDTSKLNNQISNSLENQENSIEFDNLFNEGSQINFTPNDLESTKRNEIKEFGQKLKLYEKKYILEEGLDGSMLENLINNSTAVGCNRYVDSSWLLYFLNKYNNLEIFYDDLINKAIDQEDLDAVKTIIQHNYIVSKDLLQIANDTKLQQKLKIGENEKSNVDTYLRLTYFFWGLV